MPEKFSGKEYDSIEERKTKLSQELLVIGLKYCDKILKKEIPPPYDMGKEMTFEEGLSALTDLSGEIHDLFVERTGKIPTVAEGRVLSESEIDASELRKVEQEIFARIKQARERDPENWVSAVPDIVQSVIDSVPEGNKIDNKPLEKEPQQIGLFRYNITNNIPGLENEKISSEDKCLVIHVDAPYKRKENLPENITLSKSLTLLAEKIAADYSDVKAIVAESWLIDSPVGRRIGFREFPSQFEENFHGDTFWGQFYDQNGTIKQELVDEFLKTGKAPYRVKGGYILREEFLERYLPKS